MNSREKGKRGERQWRDELRANGYAARRGQQFSGSPESPDVVCDALPWIHFEVKAVERLNIEDAMEQARRDCGRTEDRGQRTEDGARSTEGRGRRAEDGSESLLTSAATGMVGKVPVVAHRRSCRPWLVTMEAETFFRLLRGDFQPRMNADSHGFLTTKAEGRPPITKDTKEEGENFRFGISKARVGRRRTQATTTSTNNEWLRSVGRGV